MPAIPRKISDINPEKDIRVRLLGRVIDKSDNTIIIDDGSGKAEIIVENESDFERLNINDVRACPKVLCICCPPWAH